MSNITSKSSDKSSETIRGLNELLRGELAALETYNQALSVVTGDRETENDLRECQSSHRERVDRLRMEIIERGGTPDTGSGAWGVFAKAVEGTAKTVGQKMAINALEAGEDHRHEGIRGSAPEAGWRGTRHRSDRDLSAADADPSDHVSPEAPAGPDGRASLGQLTNDPVSAEGTWGPAARPALSFRATPCRLPPLA